MKISPHAMVLVLSMLLCSLAKSQQTSLLEVRPFTQQTSKLSLPGYLRLEYFKQTGQWRPANEFQWGDKNTKLWRSTTEIILDLGDQGLMGDNDAMNQWGLHIIAMLTKMFPHLNTYKVSWNFWVGAGGEAQDYQLDNYSVSYDRKQQRLEHAGGIKLEANDANVLDIIAKLTGTHD